MLGTCSSTGDPHYRTFDGLTYSFTGRCRYILAEDYINDSFTVVLDNGACKNTGLSSGKNVHVYLNNQVIVMAAQGLVTVSSNITTFPYIGQG